LRMVARRVVEPPQLKPATASVESWCQSFFDRGLLTLTVESANSPVDSKGPRGPRRGKFETGDFTLRSHC